MSKVLVAKGCEAMRFNTHLLFDGRCEAAFRLYAECLRGEIRLMMPYGSSPLASTCSPELRDKIVHATLKVGDQTLTGADVASDAYERPRGFAVQLNLDNPDEARRIFGLLAQGGEVGMPLQETFWAQQYAVLTDRFGTPWEINCA